MRNTFDFTPYRRSTIGFDRLFDLLGAAADTETYPPVDIERQGEDRYRITIAVAGFQPEEIELTAQRNLLTVAGRKQDGDDQRQYLHRGIGMRAFERRFQLADFVEVKGAELKDGLLTITLVREIPEEMKPRKIEIASGSFTQIEGQRAGPSVDQAEAA